MILAATSAQAQITIGGNVYGGGNEGDVGGNTTVTVHAGDLNEVYGGARLADVGGRAFVNIDGAHASDNIIITSVYGGNDIAGTIGSGDALPEELTDVPKTNDTEETLATKNAIDNSWNAFIRTSPTPSTATSLVVGSMFGGGNGDYDYTSDTSPYKGMVRPELGKTYLEIKGGCIAHLYGGGDNATVTGNTTICIDNNSPVLNQTNVWTTDPTELAKLAQRMQMSTFQSNLSSYAFNFARVFGGNNKAPMAIRPTWNLKNGTIRDLYSGGNAGAMTYDQGILLVVNSNGMNIDNVYGGCRMADVNPDKNDIAKLDGTFNGVECHFPAGYAARLVIAAGNINNVYGGNDISGTVYGGNAVGIRTNVIGDIYGGGNGSYAYTDNKDLKDNPIYGDFYYDVNKILGKADDHVFSGMESAQALNEFRPNAERVSIRLLGSENEPTIIHGSVYCGGNSATLKNKTAGATASAELKIGSYVIADHVFLGSNGENLIEPDLLRLYKGEVSGKDFSKMELASDTKVDDKTQFDEYMDAVSISIKPRVVFDTATDGQAYVPYSTQIGSFYCGGNVGSVKTEGVVDIDFAHEVIIFDKLVGGCNNANVPEQFYNNDKLNIAYEGGVLGSATNGNKLILNLSGLKLQPKRWNSNNTALVWNTFDADGNEVDATNLTTGQIVDADKNRRLKGGNVYGGCYNSGHVDGNVVINQNASTVDLEGAYAVFDDVNESNSIVQRRSGVILDYQGEDVLGGALNIFGGGFGADSEIWGSTTININKGYSFQVFGGGEEGIIGKPNDGEGTSLTFNGKTFKYNSKYSCTINLNGQYAGVYKGHADDNADMAEAEFIYGGGFHGPIVGDTKVNLGNGRVYQSFGGSCNADILGHTETYVGLNSNSDTDLGFPYVRDNVYGGNDLGGQILGKASFIGRVNTATQSMVYNPISKEVPDVEVASAYMEYIQGRVNYIFGGCYGVYDYKDPHFKDFTYTTGADGTTTDNIGTARPGFIKPRMDNAFVNFKPAVHSSSSVNKIYGAGQGRSADSDRDIMQNSSYILIDAPQEMTRFQDMEVFGAGDFSGLGMYQTKTAYGVPLETAKANENGVTAAAVIDLIHGQIAAAYGGSYNEGVTRRSIINVPGNSTINIQNIFGGAYGTQILPACDVYESNVNYRNTSEQAKVTGAIYGGNNSERRTMYTKVNISSPVWSNKTEGFLAKIYGAGKGVDTWSEYTEVNLESGAKVYEVYGGGELGHVLNSESVQKYMQLYSNKPSAQISTDDPNWSKSERWTGDVGTSDLKDEWKRAWQDDWKAAWTLSGYYDSKGEYIRYASNENVNLCNTALVRTAEIDDRNLSGFSDEVRARIDHKFNTNVIIHEGATVVNYAYGGGWGKAEKPLSGDVYGTTYIALLGGTVTKDIYAAGTSGAVYNLFGAEDFTASTNVYVKGGTVRNVYGGGWEGSVGYHEGEISSSTTDDRPGETHVVIGILDGNSLVNGIPAIERNAYGGGEGGAVYGTANITLNNGYIGYKWLNGYQENIVDETLKDKNGNFIPNTNLETSGNVFGGGYVDNSSVDIANVKIYDGVIRSSVYGGGEIAAVGRGDVYGEDAGASAGSLKGIYKAGQTHVHVYDGWVKRNVFGGGKGLDNLGRTGSLHTNGYVFGQTDVRIHGGEIGTDEGVAQGYGNVFGGGDIGFVYSAFEYPDGSLGLGKKSGARYDDHDEGYYYKSKGGNFTDADGVTLTESADKFMTEDSHVLIEPHCRVTASNGGTEDNPSAAVTINGHNYFHGDYVPTSDLNTLKDKTTSSATWKCLDVDGIIIHNAIFAGGNVSSGSDQVYANATTLYGNATASIHDVYHRDLITVGTGHTGGLYGDGNLTFVDGYRGLNITNYGTDFYHIFDDITLDQYELLTPREAAYYELKYKCVQACTDNEGTTYSVGSTIAQDELIALFAGQTSIVYADGTVNSAYWIKNGVVSKYAGRIMNTIQRADFCGVFGSRMVMKGAQDRVPEIVDYTNYTINRVREVSLNKKASVAGDTEEKHKTHGNYFGIYNIVNYLGALTSDVNFYNDIRTTDNTNSIYKADISLDGSTYAYGNVGATYYNWKRAHINDRTRNNGTSHNQVALASGVYLELTTEKSTGNGLNEKDWGYITGVVELDLINVQSGVGGGFVYAKNVHGRRSDSGKTNLILTDMNQGAVTNRSFVYTTDDDSQMEWQSSGNFVHGEQTIIDDCYDVGGKYKGTDKVPAHYWFIKGQVYVYDQYVSAYTGAPNAYSETVNIPLTITAASHGTMRLLNVQPNRYAYYSTYNGSTQKKLEGDNKVVINDVEYHLNDPISYWDWNLLSKSTERNLFVEDTYVVIADCKIGNTAYAEGTVLLKTAYEALMPGGVKPTNVTQKKMVDGVEQYVPVDFDFVFRSSNNLSHDTGYILTYNVNNPTVWNKYYTLNNGTRDDKITIDAYNNLDLNDQAAYTDGPTYSPIADGLYGQRDYKVSDIITQEVYDTYQAAKTAHPDVIPTTQAVFEPAYVVTSYLETVNKDGTEQRLQEGARLCASDYTDTKWSAMSGSVAEAYVCTSTIQLTKTDFIYNGELMSLAQKNALKSQYDELAADIDKLVVPAYYCSTAGPYGGNYYETGKNYRALEAFSSMSAEDREKFTFNYDALDLLIDPDYGGTEGQKYQYDGYSSYSAENADKMIYSLEKQVDYTAIYNGTTETTEGGLVNGKEYSREEYEALQNEQRHYAPISVPRAGEYYVVNTPFIIGETPYSVGTVIESSTYSSFDEGTKAKVTKLSFTADQVASDGSTYYYCRESYTGTVNVTASNVSGGVSYTSGTVPVGVVIAESTYTQLPNRQKNFSIHGTAPTETSTLFVSRNSDIFDLSKDKIITVIYEYNYEESDESGLHITPVSERHVVNIHLQFKSGIPTVEDITKPSVVIPGTSVTLRTPDVTPGAYEVTGGGWEIFENLSDAESHMNGVDYSPATDPLYWYQDGYYVAYYAQTYLGKTYSNHVPLSVANYHDLKKVMDDKKYHLHVDYDLKRMKRKSKIYINDYTSSSQNGLDLLKDFYDLSVGTSLAGHDPLNSHVRGCNDLEFILHSDIDHSAAWTSLGSPVCFAGNFHGDGHTISGLNNSLFDNLCGNVYNLGVTGSFTGAGIAETGDGYVENCWIKTTGTPVSGTGHYAVFGNPSRSGESNLVQVVNSYYPASNNYTVPTGEALKHGKPIQMADKAFYNGEVAYDLNGFYLYKRYCDQKVSSGNDYLCNYIKSDGTMELLTKHYGTYDNNTALLCSAGYVESRYEDGDFRYADGSIPTTEEKRSYTVTDTNSNEVTRYAPIWPHDYIFFGQSLTYDYTGAHQSHPSTINKRDGLIVDGTGSNHVHRAPAYFGSKAMGVAHFNPVVTLAAYSKPPTETSTDVKEAYPGMTAIDFAGHGDTEYKLGLNGDFFYQPLLDDDGLYSIENASETRNLLVYAPTEAANKKTYDVLNGYFTEPAYSTYANIDTYGSVGIAPSTVFGHLVQNNLTTTTDHLLVDKQDFNCPISYTMGSGHRMWYQRTPDKFVNIESGNTKGWDNISLPFKVSYVATLQKGEITHFYKDNTTGHEYWLRKFAGNLRETSTSGVYAADFNLLEADGADKPYSNTFLWDYYYSKNLNGNAYGDDANGDDYKQYYNESHTYTSYPLEQAGGAYLIGFPGKSYYEFDLSGEWTAANTASPAPDMLGKQTITFASDPAVTIAISDTEISAGKTVKDGYAYVANYVSKKFTNAGDCYVLADDGASYVKNTADAIVSAFRPYIVEASNAPARGKDNPEVEQVVFGMDQDTDFLPHDDIIDRLDGTLNIYAKKGKTVVVESSLRYTVDVSIYTPAGVVLYKFPVKAGETVEQRVNSNGVYIVHSDDGQHVKKVIVR